MSDLSSRELLAAGMNIFAGNPDMLTMRNICNLRIAARMKWEQEEMGGLEHVQFSHRNDTPIVPLGHCAHPLELVKRGFVDGKGWLQNAGKPDIKLFKWPDGNHWYASVDGVDVVENGIAKWNTAQEAEGAAKRSLNNHTKKGPQ